MFGYVNPDKPNLLMKEYALYRAYYCGVCKTTGKVFGQTARFATNYDIAFFAALCHDFLDYVPEIYQGVCVLNPVKKKDIIGRNPLLERIAAINLILFYQKLRDDSLDKGGIKGAVKPCFSRAYKKACALCPEFSVKAEQLYNELRAREKAGESSIDIAADSSACMLKEAARAVIESHEGAKKLPEEILGQLECLYTLCYNVGKWVYLADALDDIEEDYAKKRYNPFVAAFDYSSIDGKGVKVDFMKQHHESVEFLFNTTISAACEALKGIKRGHSCGLIDNIVFRGLPQKTRQLLAAPKKLPQSKV